MTGNAAERILLARFHSLGDVILATGLVSRLVENGASVDVATADRFLPLFEGLPINGLHAARDISGITPFDRVIDLQGNATSRRLLRGLGPARSPRTRPLRRRWMVFWGRRAPRFPVPHAVLRYAEAAGCLDPDPRTLRPTVVVTERDRLEAQDFPLAIETSTGTCVGLAVGGSRRMKRWPSDRFDSLAESLASRGLATLRFLEPSGEAEEGRGEVRAPLRALKAILARCRILVTNDSGVMHLAVALGVQVVAIFGSTVPEFGFAPLGDADHVLDRALPCRPCAPHGARFCWLGHERCLRAIGVDEVLAETLGALREGGLKEWTGISR
jgi:ADP-heptose:LPS heptosyltransferase